MIIEQTSTGKKKSSILKTIVATFVFTILIALVAVSPAYAATDTVHPTIVSVSPTNNEMDNTRHERIMVTFSEEMNPATINKNTFTVIQRTTPKTGEYESRAIDGTIAYANRKATFTPKEMLNPNQHFGNVFTVTLTPGIQDLADNSLARNYMWSFTTGDNTYNTGASTAQLSQSSGGSTIIPPAQTPQTPQVASTTPPPAGPAIVEQSASLSRGWIIGGAFLLLIAALFIWAYFVPTSTTQKIKKKARMIRSSPFGDVHPVMDIEGIGPVYSKKLQAMGIEDTKQLWEAKPATLSSKTGVPLSMAESWQHMAELASVKDIGPQYAELLERSGVHTIDQLKDYKTADLLKLVRKKQASIDVNIQGNTPGTALVGNWIEQANEHTFSVSKEGQTA